MIKTMTVAILHVGVAFGVAYAFTGSFIIGGLMALIEPACNTVVFYFHEKTGHCTTMHTPSLWWMSMRGLADTQACAMLANTLK